MNQIRYGVVVTLATLLFGCGPGDRQAGHEHEADLTKSVTAWGDTYEIFAEYDPLIAGRKSKSHTHVTVLEDFSPLREGTVTAVLAASGREQRFVQQSAVRDGIFTIEIASDAAGIFALTFHVASASGTEAIACGLVTVMPGPETGEVSPHVHDDDHAHEQGHANVQMISFLKEQQWRTAFRTQRVETGSIGESVRGPARLRAPAGGEVVITAPLDGIVEPRTRLHAGLEVRTGDELLRLAPRAPGNVNLPELEADMKLSRARLDRLESLLAIGAVSQAEVEAARARVASLELRIAAARGDTGAGSVAVRAPFSGRIAETRVVPGQAVSAGDALLRLLSVPPVWVELNVRSHDAGRVRVSPSGLILTHPGSDPIEIGADLVSLVSISPETDPETGLVVAIYEVARLLSIPVGTSVEAEVVLAGERAGVVVPASAVVDDAGVDVVYLQAEGETFVRREVTVEARQGSRVLLRGVDPGARIVTVGGTAIRRSDIMSSGAVEAHVH